MCISSVRLRPLRAWHKEHDNQCFAHAFLPKSSVSLSQFACLYLCFTESKLPLVFYGVVLVHRG